MKVSFHAIGHRLLSATHGKSLEITTAREITARATCVIGVRAKLPSAELRELRGRVRVLLAADGATSEIVGQVNPTYASESRLILRRSAVPDADTFLVHADKGADDLPRELVDALRITETFLEVEITELQAPPPFVVVRPDRGLNWRGIDDVPDDLRSLRLRVDRVEDLAESPLAASLRGRKARWLVDGYVGVDGPTAALLLSVGVPLAPLLLAGQLPVKRREREQALHAAASSPYTVVLRVPDDRALEPAGIAEILGPQRRILVGDGAVDHGWRAREMPIDELAADDLAAPPHLLVLAATGDTPRATIDAHALARLLQDAGLTSRSVNEVLEELGFGRRPLYRA